MCLANITNWNHCKIFDLLNCARTMILPNCFSLMRVVDGRKKRKQLPLWRMWATPNGTGWRAFLVLHNQFIDDVSAVHATTSHSHDRLTGSTQVNEVFFYQVPSASDAPIPLTDHAPFVIWVEFHFPFVLYLTSKGPETWPTIAHGPSFSPASRRGYIPLANRQWTKAWQS